MGKLNNVSDQKYFYRSQGNVFFHGRGSDCLLKVCRVKQVYECTESNVKEDAQLYEANFSNACGQNCNSNDCFQSVLILPDRKITRCASCKVFHFLVI